MPEWRSFVGVVLRLGLLTRKVKKRVNGMEK